MQHVALQNPIGNNDPQGTVRAINMSFSLVPTPGTPFDGSSTLTLGLDWSARVHDVLYVDSAENLGDQRRMPRDNYNGLVVTASRWEGGSFTTVSDQAGFTTAAGGRRVIDLVAPGDDIQVPIPGGGYVSASGTSFAAPHATGTVALLQQYAEEQIAAGAAGWDANARHHQVMKAVLMNSADKVAIGRGGPNNPIGMRRTIYNNDGTIWLQSDASDDTTNPGGKALPLDLQMGVGQLNAARALNQFKSGKTGMPAPGGTVPAIGWDYGTMTGLGDIKKYPISNLTANYIAITLAWDRWVGLLELPGGTPNFYEPNRDSFTPGGVPHEEENGVSSEWRSVKPK